jgi:hypothetical protein
MVYRGSRSHGSNGVLESLLDGRLPSHLFDEGP